MSLPLWAGLWTACRLRPRELRVADDVAGLAELDTELAASDRGYQWH